VPVKVTDAVDATAVEAAVNVMLCAVPGVSVSAAGLAVAPEGSPVIATATVLLNEFTALASTLTFAPVAPAVMVSEVGESVSEKFGGGAAAVTVNATVAE
jgi:hypothetical protein